MNAFLTPEQIEQVAAIVGVAELTSAPLMTAEQVAEHLGVSERYVWRLSRDGALPRVELGKYVRFDPADVAAFVDERRAGPRRSRAHVEEAAPRKAKALAASRRRF